MFSRSKSSIGLVTKLFATPKRNAVSHTDTVLSMSDQLTLARKISVSEKKLYGPFIHKTKNNDDLKSIVDGKNLRLNSNSGISGRTDGVYALARVTPSELAEEISSGLNKPLHNSVVFYTTVEPRANPGGHTGPHVSWSEADIPKMQLTINPVLSISSGTLAVEDRELAQFLQKDLPQNSLLKAQIQEKNLSSLPPSIGVDKPSASYDKSFTKTQTFDLPEASSNVSYKL